METTHRAASLCWTALVALGLSACGAPDTFDRRQMLRDTVDEVILPTHQTLDERAAEVTSAATSLCSDGATQEELDAARSSWRSLQEPLKQIQAWSFNMSPYRGSSFEILFYKIDREPSWGDNIEAVIDGGEATYRRDLRVDGDEDPDRVYPEGEDDTIDVDFVEAQDYRRNAEGYPAVEYLLFGSEDDRDTLSMYASDAEDVDRRCAYLTAVATHAERKVDAYVDAWARDGGNFAATYGAPSLEEMDWTTVQDSIDAMVSQMVFATKQRISKNLLGGPLGQHTDNPNIPDRVASPHAGATAMQIEETFAGMEKLYRGPSGRSLADYAKFRKSAVHRQVVEQMETADSALADLPEPLSDAVESDRAAVESAQQEVDRLTRRIEADLKTSLGASTTRVVVDND